MVIFGEQCGVSPHCLQRSLHPLDPDAPEDVLVISSEFKLLDLIEDEVLMALPVVARHDTCPVEVRLTVADPGFEAAAAEKRNPFAVLAELKKPKPD